MGYEFSDDTGFAAIESECEKIISLVEVSHVNFGYTKSFILFYKGAERRAFIPTDGMDVNPFETCALIAAGAVKTGADSVMVIKETIVKKQQISETAYALVEYARNHEFNPTEQKTTIVRLVYLNLVSARTFAIGYEYTGGGNTGEPVVVGARGKDHSPGGMNKFRELCIKAYTNLKEETEKGEE